MRRAESARVLRSKHRHRSGVRDHGARVRVRGHGRDGCVRGVPWGLFEMISPNYTT